MSNRVLDKREGGAFIPAATTRLSVMPHRAMLNLAFEISKAFSGGYWVMGTVTLTESALKFHPSWKNLRIFRNNGLDIEIALKNVISVRTDKSFALSYRTISVETSESTLKIRCTDADSFAENIKAAIR